MLPILEQKFCCGDSDQISIIEDPVHDIKKTIEALHDYAYAVNLKILGSIEEKYPSAENELKRKNMKENFQIFMDSVLERYKPLGDYIANHEDGLIREAPLSLRNNIGHFEDGIKNLKQMGI